MNLLGLLLLALVAATAFVAFGYLVGARRGLAARAALRADVSRAASAEAQLGAEVRAMQGRLEAASQELIALRRAGSSSDSKPPEALRGQIDATLRALLGPLLERDSEARELREAVSGLLRPMVERERLGLELTRLDADLVGRAGLPAILTAVATRGGFSTVLISDDNGLPLATNEGARNTDLLGASTSLLLTLVDRIARDGGAAPFSAVLRDTDNRLVLHRIFRVGQGRYVLTAVGSGAFLSPDVLDPTLARIERVLANHALAD